jgi:solute carrier family 12 (potassium/chloride transporters), member 9
MSDREETPNRNQIPRSRSNVLTWNADNANQPSRRSPLRSPKPPRHETHPSTANGSSRSEFPSSRPRSPKHESTSSRLDLRDGNGRPNMLRRGSSRGHKSTYIHHAESSWTARMHQAGPKVGGVRTEKLGTFSGVFLPTTLNVLSILMFLRFGFILGQSGFLGMMGESARPL